jgi:hypothetical protein
MEAACFSEMLVTSNRQQVVAVKTCVQTDPPLVLSQATWIQSTSPGSTYLSPVSVVACSPNTGLRSKVLSSNFLTKIIGLEIFYWNVKTKYPCGTYGTDQLQAMVAHRSACPQLGHIHFEKQYHVKGVLVFQTASALVSCWYDSLTHT